MSTLASTFPPDDVLVFGNAQTVIGTAMLGNNVTAPTYPTF